jgi:hypothetical protein
MGSWSDVINSRLKSFRQKYYFNLFVRGVVISLSLLLGYFLFAVLSEYFLWLDSWARLLLVGAFVGLAGFCIWKFLLKPLQWFTMKKGLTAEEAARIIGGKLHTVDDRLLNIIQLSQQQGNPLTEASLQQKFGSLQNVSFEQVVDLRENRKYLPYLLIPVAIVLALLIGNSGIITKSTERIIHYNQQYSPQAPFTFKVLNQNLTAFYGEDFVLRLQIAGESIPEDVYIAMQGQNFKMTGTPTKELVYTFEKVQSGISFQFYASGFYSEQYQINLITRPELASLKVSLAYPSYLGKAGEEIENAGNLEVPEGTKITWRLNTSNTTKGIIGFRSSGLENEMQHFEDQGFTFSKNIQNPDQYWITLSNDESENKDKINYSISVIKDQYPELVVSQMRDSVLYKNIFIGGSIADDHGLSQLKLSYDILKDGKNSTGTKSITIPINRKLNRQEFVYQWSIDSLKLQPNDQLSYFVQVWDNDGVNGSKSTKSASYVFHIPTKAEIKNEIAKSESKTESDITESIQKAETLREKIEDAQKKLKGKQTLDWQDKAMLEDIMRQKQDVDKMLNELAKQNKELEEKRETFTERDERIKEKADQLQKLMNELLDEETKKLFEELEKLLKENNNMDQTQKLLNKMQQSEMNLEKELDRLKELFQQMKFDTKMEETINDLNEAIEKQKDLMEKTDKLSEDKKSRNNPDSLNNLAEKQEEVKESVEEAKEDLKELEELNQQNEEQEELPGEEKMNEAQEQMEQSKENMKQGEPKKSKENQQKALDKMQQMKEQMEGMSNSMEMEMNMENMESLRQILHGLIKLSFDQEKNTQEFNEVQQTDPRYLGITQNQLKLQDDAKVLEDSLLALGKRDPFMGSIVIKEVGELNDHLNKSVENIRERRKPNASSEMQLSMTSINNLALMLNDHFEMMMQMMQQAKAGKGKSKQKSNMKLSEMQQQLNQQIEDVKKSGKTGRELSEEMARLAAEQERIRQGLQELEKKLNNQNGQNGKKPGNIAGQMEQTEMDLVNKQITEMTIRRQKEILSRLLESEKSMREQDLDEERKGESAKDYTKEMPKEFLEYLKLKEKEVELLKTVPLKLYPYYKREASEYFKRIGNE